jgi:hypothetical protein
MAYSEARDSMPGKRGIKNKGISHDVDENKGRAK